MEESLKSIRLLHRLILASCGLMLYFAFTPQIMTLYKNALTETDYIDSFDIYEFIVYIDETVDNKYINHFFLNKINSNNTGFSFSPSEVVNDTYNDIANNFNNLDTVNSYIDFFSKDHIPSIYIPKDTEDNKSVIDNLITECRENNSYISDASIMTNDSINSNKIHTATLTFACENDDDYVYKSGEILIDIVEFKDNTLYSWLEATGENKILSNIFSEKIQWLPSLNKLREEIGNQ